jgi:hypothetical protein
MWESDRLHALAALPPDMRLDVFQSRCERGGKEKNLRPYQKSNSYYPVTQLVAYTIC